MKTGRNGVLLVVFLTVFLDLLGFGIIIPVLPFYAETLGASPAVVTWLGASFSLMQFLFAPVFGRISDRVGRRPVMLFSIAAAAAGFTLFGFSTTLAMLFFSRMLSGIGMANLGTAGAIIADSTDAQSRAKGMGLMGVAFGLGFTLGPAIGGLFVRWGLAAPAFAAAALSALNLVLAFWLLPETNTSQAATSAHGGFSLRALRHAARHANVGALFLLYLTFASAFSMMEQVLGLYIERVWAPGAYERAARLTAYSLMVVGLTAIVIQGGCIGRLAKRFGEGALLRAGTFLVAVSFVLIPAAGTAAFVWFLPVCVVMAAGSGITNPSLLSLLSQSVDPDEQGGVLGLGQGLAALGRILGPSVAGLFFQVAPTIPFWVGAGLLLVCTGIALRLPYRAAARVSAAAPATGT